MKTFFCYLCSKSSLKVKIVKNENRFIGTIIIKYIKKVKKNK